MMNHQDMSEIYKAEFEQRDNGQRINNPALNWQQVTSEVASLDNRNAGRGYMVYAQRRVFEQETHEQAMEWIVNQVQWM